MAYEFKRNQVDASKEVSVTMLTGGANSPSIDLEQEIGGDIEAVAAEIEIPVEALLTDAKNLFFALEDSADNSSFSALDPAITTSVVGVDTAVHCQNTVDRIDAGNEERFLTHSKEIAGHHTTEIKGSEVG